MRIRTPATALAVLLTLGSPSNALAQMHRLRVISNDSVPVVYAFVRVDGGTGLISDEKGEVILGQGKKETLSLVVRRIGYAAWSGKLEFPDTAAILTVTLPRLAQQLAAVAVTDAPNRRISLALQPFYDRWLMRQKGLLSATFIGPEELEFRHPSRLNQMLDGLNGVSIRRFGNGSFAAFNSTGCPMAIVVDGNRRCPAGGCKAPIGDLAPGAEVGVNSNGSRTIVTHANALGGEATLVDLNQVANASDVVAIEVYARGGNMPVTLQVSDQACGVIAIWTGSRRP